MKYFITVYVCLFFIVSCKNDNKTAHIITNNTLAKVRLGMPLDSAIAMFKADKYYVEKVDIDNTIYTEYYVYLNDLRTEFIQIQPNCIPQCKVNQMLTNSTLFSTAKGLSIGKNVAELKANYSFYYTLKDAQNIYIFTKELPNVGFIIDRNKLNSSGANFTWDELPNSSLIKQILVHL